MQDYGLLPYSTDVKASELQVSSFFKVSELLPRRCYGGSWEGSGPGGLQIIQPLSNTWGREGSICVRTSSMEAAALPEMCASLQISARCQNPKDYHLIRQHITSVSDASV